MSFEKARQYAEKVDPGVTILPFKQKTYLEKNNLAIKGVCGPLCVLWMEYQYKNGKTVADLFEHIGTPQGLHTVGVQKSLQSKEPFAHHLKLEQAGYKPFLVDKFQAEPAAARVVTPGVFLLTVSSQTSAHVVAINSFTQSLFDPNLGEFTFTSRDALEQFVKGLMKNMYKKYTGPVVVEHFLPP